MRPASLPPENPYAPRSYGALTPVSDQVWLWRNIVNSTVVVGRDAVAIIDTQVNAAAAKRLIQAVHQQFNKPIRYAITTHYHWDHCGGSHTFAGIGAELVCSDGCAQAMHTKQTRQRAFLESRGFILGEDPPIPAHQVAREETLDLGDCRLLLRRGHAAESDDPLLIWVEQDGILAAGDTVMTGSFPIFGQPVQREGLEDERWLHALAEVRGFGAKAVCPGHGPLADAAALDRLEGICRWYLESVADCHRRGLDLAATLAELEARIPAEHRALPEVWGTPRYAILRAWAGVADLGQPGWQHVKPSAIPHSSSVALPQSDQLRHWLETAHQALEGGDVASAVSLCQEAARRFSSDPEAHCVLAETLIHASRGIASVLEKGDCFQAARHAWAQARSLNPQHGRALLGEARYLSHLAFRGGEDTAMASALLAQAEAAVTSHRERAECAFLRGLLSRSRGEETAAKAAFAAALQLDPGCFGARLALQD